MKLKLREKFKDENMQIYGLSVLVYLMGMLADGLGFLNSIINGAGIVLSLAGMVFIATLVVIWHTITHDYIKAFFINICYLLLGMLIILICYNLNMTAVVTTAIIFVLLNFILLIMDMYFIGYHYYKESERHEREKRKF